MLPNDPVAPDEKGHRLVARLRRIRASTAKRDNKRNPDGHLDADLPQVVTWRQNEHALDALAKVSPKMVNVAGETSRNPLSQPEELARPCRAELYPAGDLAKSDQRTQWPPLVFGVYVFGYLVRG